MMRSLPWTAGVAGLVIASISYSTRVSAQTRSAHRATAVATSPAISAAALRTHLFAFADDSMQGREAGTLGNVRATDYIVAKVRAMGLRPAGEHDTYFQTVPLVSRSVDAERTSVVAGGTKLAFGTEVLGVAKVPFDFDSVPVVYGGLLGDTLHSLTPAQVSGKFVVYGPPTSPDAMAGAPPSVLASARGSGAAILQMIPPPVVASFQKPIVVLSTPQPRAPSLAMTMMVTPASAEKMIGAPLAGLAVGASGQALSAHLAYKDRASAFPARNVVAMIPGADPKLRGEYIAIGAHSDHLGIDALPVDHDSLRIYNHIVRPGGAEQRDKEATPAEQEDVNKRLAAWRHSHVGTAKRDSIYNGADDDGSGSVALLEIARYLSSLPIKPRRSILFVWHTAEEKGHLGSHWFVEHSTVPRDSIVAQLNMDMIGRGGTNDAALVTAAGVPMPGGPDFVEVVGARRRSTELGELVEHVNAESPHALHIDYTTDAHGHPTGDYCRSDHLEYARYGIPVAYFKTGRHSDYHQVTDEAQYIDYTHFARVTRFVADVALRLANLDHRVTADKPAPDSLAACEQ
jgi:hypothetical protein